MLKHFARMFVGGFALFAASLQIGNDAHAQGIVLPGVGPVNRSMSGAATAAPLDAAGAIHWNPATISTLKGNEILFGVEFIDSQTTLSSSLPPAFGGASGSTDSNSGIKTLPTVALVWKPCDSPWTFGLGALGVGGFGVDYAASATNPILTAQPPAGVGTGALYSRLGLLQIVPTASLQLTDNLSVGFAPTATIADLQLDPFFSASPGAAGYPSAINTRNYWGLGFQLGAYLTTESNWNFGASYKSPQWFETFQFNTTTAAGVPETLSIETQFPAIYSLGTSYTGIDRLLLAFDMRYIDYENTDVFGDPVGFTPTFAATGLGWQSVFSYVTAAQYQVTDQMSVRAGYMYNQNPIPDSATMANVQSSALYTHSISLGASMAMTRAMTMHLAWVHSFEMTSTGPYVTPLTGPIAGSSVSITQANDALTAGLTVKF